MNSKKPDYYIERNGQKVPVYIIDSQTTKPKKKRNFLNIPRKKKKSTEVNPLEFMNWNETALYC